MLSFTICCPFPLSPGTHGEPVAVYSADLWTLSSGLLSLFHLSVFLNLDSKLIFITDYLEAQKFTAHKISSSAQLVLCYY